MKLFKLLTLFIATISLSSCEDKINVDLETAAPKLVIDAAIKWQKGTNGNKQQIKLSTTAQYFGTEIPKVAGATVFITDSDNVVFNFVETDTLGNYNCTNFIPVLNKNYKLTVVYKNETYEASENLMPAPQIERIEQKNQSGFSGNDIQIKAFFTDDGTQDNFYLFQYQSSDRLIPTFDLSKDEFYQGNEIFGIYQDENLKAGQTLAISILGISEKYYNYMNILVTIAGSTAGSPFQSPPATVRGNVKNTTNERNYPLGYFSLSETDFRNYVIE
jgi:hypothetical protein